MGSSESEVLEMETTTGTSGNYRLIGGIAIEPIVVEGQGPTAIGSEEQPTMDWSSALPIQPAAQPAVSQAITTPTKRPRGRPRKVQVDVPKRGRGRPRKVTQGTNGESTTSFSERVSGGPSITDTDYNPSCIDKLMEDMISKKNNAQFTLPEKTKRPVGRPRKRPLDTKPSSRAKKFKGDVSLGGMVEGTKTAVLDSLFAILPQEDPTLLPLPLAVKVNSETSKFQISKEMVDKMIGKARSGQVSWFYWAAI